MRSAWLGQFTRLYERLYGSPSRALAVYPCDATIASMKTRTPARLLAILLLLVLSVSMSAQKPQVLPPSAPEKTAPALPQASQVAAQLSREDLEAFFDGFIPTEIQRDDIAGAVVAVVKDGKVLFAKGYGWSDVKERKPVTVDATLFRPGSISKTFTWTAVMQLYEQGQIDLDRDVNDYLDFKIPATFRQAGHDERPDDAHAGLRGNGAGSVLEQRLGPDLSPAVCAHARTGGNLSAGNDSGVLELRRDPGRLHRAARFRNAVRRLCREEHFSAARTCSAAPSASRYPRI